MKFRVILFLCAIVSVGASTAWAQSLSRVVISVPGAPVIAGQLTLEGYDVLQGSIGEGSFELIVTESELDNLRDQGFEPVVIEVSRPFREIQAERADAEFGGGISILAEPNAVPIGYSNLSTVLNRMSTAAAAYPAICQYVDLTAKYGTPTTFEGRHLFALKISDNVTTDEDEPVQLVVSAHHAREIVTPELALYAIEQLTNLYGSDPTITALVNEYEIWIAPVWNPDGYNHVFEVNNMWRKNRHVFAEGIGVDQNRNYPFGWETSCGGSTLVTSNTYKGTSPASEAETQTMIAWTEERGFDKVLDFHSYGRYTIYGYGNCWIHPHVNFWRQEAQVISVTSGYSGNVSQGGIYGEHFMWQQAMRGAHSFLTEIAGQFQPTFAEAVTEVVQVYPSVITQLQRAILLSGHVTDVLTGNPIIAEITYPDIVFQGENRNVSNERFGRYHVFFPEGEHRIQFEADGYYKQIHTIDFTADTAQTLEVALVPKPVIISLTDGPDEFEVPGATPAVEVRILSNAENYVPGTGRIWYRYDDAAFTSIALTQSGIDLYQATLPAVDWGNDAEFYFSAAGDGGGAVIFPDNAPSDVFDFAVAVQSATFFDSFETDKGWVAENLGAGTGDWQRGEPVNDPDWSYGPQNDADGNGYGYFTQNEIGNTDVDGGAVRLTSPTLDLTRGRVSVKYDYFLRLNEPGEKTDHLLVEIDSNNGAGPWIVIADHDTDGGLSWRRHEIDQAYLYDKGVELTTTMKVRFTANDADTQSIVEAGIDAFSVNKTYLWPLNMRLLNGPGGLIDPGISPNVSVEIKSVLQNFVAGSAILWYRFNQGVFQSIPLVPTGGDLNAATLPNVDWGDVGEYFITAQSDQGVTAFLPEYAPTEVYSFTAGVNRIAFSDNFQTDKDWFAENLGATSGYWQRGVPIDDPCWFYDPASDSDGSGQCWLTENLNNPAYTTPWNTDIDDGAVRLTSPAIDMSYGQISIAYDYFLNLSNTEGNDHLLVEINVDGNGPWVLIADHNTDGELTWRHHLVDWETLQGLGIIPTVNSRLRFTANDGETPSIVEAGIDAIRINSTMFTRPGDMDGDNDVDLFDYALFSDWWLLTDCGLCGGADRSGDNGAIGLSDLLLMHQNWLKGKY
ncbi:MAG: hypothetical protein GY869_20430 [Planctomycetes bacterium]|nr:hypothetical protein [Planctomycetota bacterium]